MGGEDGFKLLPGEKTVHFEPPGSAAVDEKTPLCVIVIPLSQVFSVDFRTPVISFSRRMARVTVWKSLSL